MVEYKINEEVYRSFKEVLLIDETGNKLGIMPSKVAYYKAHDKNYDLVCVAPGAQPPVCKIMDYGKYKYEQLRKEKEIKRNQNNVEIQEVQISFMTQDHDLEVKAKTIKRLITEKGNDVRIVLRLKGREEAYREAAKPKVYRLVEMCSEFATIKKDIFDEGRDIKLILEKKKS